MWKFLRGKKTKIGFVLASTGEIVSQFEPAYGFPLLVAGYVLGGVGLADALIRAARAKGK